MYSLPIDVAVGVRAEPQLERPGRGLKLYCAPSPSGMFQPQLERPGRGLKHFAPYCKLMVLFCRSWKGRVGD